MESLNAAKEILLAAAVLSGEDRKEFSEWDLTIQVWRLNKNRFGCRGYEKEYPDHKRVMMELMGKNKMPRDKGWIEKTHTNHYRITMLGLAEAARLSGGERATHTRNLNIYDSLRQFAFHPVFEAYLQSPEEPKTWLGAAAFFALSKNSANELRARLKLITSGTEDALELMKETHAGELRRGDSGRSISRERLEKLKEFLKTLENRFKAQYEAIMKRID